MALQMFMHHIFILNMESFTPLNLYEYKYKLSQY